MCSLQGFPPVAPDGQVSLCEVEGRVHTGTGGGAQLHSRTSAVAKHPIISISHELLHPSTSREDARQVFIPVDEPLLERFFNIWLEQGLMSALHLVSQSDNTPALLRLAASCTMKLGEAITHVQNTFYPQLRESGPEVVSAVSTTRDWLHSPIRYIAWHPHCTKLAVAALDDSIRVFCPEAGNTPILKRKEQRDISCMAWRPFSASELAVGCEVGVFVWQVDPNSVVSRPSIGCTTLLKRAGHSPVTSLAWSPQGDLLLSASAADTTMYLWDTTMESAVPLKRMGGRGVALVTWAPDSFKVFAATSGIVFRVWDTRLWTPERWRVMSGHVQAACWSPCGSLVLFCTSEEPVVYSLTFKQVNTVFQAPTEESATSAMPVIDLTQLELEDEGESIGGCVVAMVWDNKGHHLAITFRNSNLVAVFRTELLTIFQVSPCCFVRGMSGEVPNVICFQQNFTDGAVLTIGWSSGRVQYFPIICSDLLTSPAGHSMTHERGITTPLSNNVTRRNDSTLWRL